MSKLKIKEAKGITLVALIITIIVLIILAAVTIKIAFDSNFLKIAAEGAENYAKAQEKEEEIMQNLSDFADDVVRNITNGAGNGGEDTEPELPEGWDKDKVYPVESEDGIEVPVPKGFVASKVKGEKKVNDGFVIYQGTEDVTDENANEARTSRNQFVWIPVEDPSEMFGTDADGDSLGKLYDFGTTGKPKNPPIALNWTETDGVMKWTNISGSGSYRESDILTNSGYDDKASNYTDAGIKDKNGNPITTSAQFKVQLQEEFEQMRTSVEKYHGFYIGRYETGNLSKEKTTVIKGDNDISSQTWYAMYQKSKSIVEGTGTTSSMIWGCTWDATMKWFLKDSTTAEYVTNADNKGNWSGSQTATGSSDNYRIKNIYDMAGNVSEWILEAYNTSSRVGRGGDFTTSIIAATRGAVKRDSGNGNNFPMNKSSGVRISFNFSNIELINNTSYDT